MIPSTIHARFNPRLMQQGALNNFVLDENSFDELSMLGIGLDVDTAMDMFEVHQRAQRALDLKDKGLRHAMDAAPTPQPLVTTASIPALIQYLQTLMPGYVRVATTARVADLLTGVKVVGNWDDEQLVQGDDELVGTPVPYADNANTPFASYNVNFNTRTVVRFELGLEVGLLAQARAARIRVSDDANRRQACIQAFEILRNTIAFYGYNNGANRTYGILNDLGLPNYITFPTGVAGITWALKTYLEICNDITVMAGALLTQTGGVINAMGPDGARTTLCVSTSTYTYLTKQNALGTQSVLQWIKENFPNMRILNAPQFNNAVGGNTNVVYLYAEEYKGDGSTDGGMAWDQLVPMKFKVLGVRPDIKGYKESYTNALAGVMTYRPWLFVRYQGN